MGDTSNRILRSRTLPDDSGRTTPIITERHTPTEGKPKIEVVITKPPPTKSFDMTSFSKKRGRTDDDINNERQSKIPRSYLAGVYVDNALIAQATQENQEYPFVNSITQRVLIPVSYEAAINDPVFGHQWREAIEREIEAIEGNDT